MPNIFDLLIVKPFAFVLMGIYNIVGSYGLAIILFTIFTKLILLPLSIKSKKGMLDLQRIGPKQKELEQKYKNDKKKYSEELTKLYQKEGVSPMGGCLPMLITIPIMMGLYWPISQPLTHLMNLTSDQITLIGERLGFVGNGINSQIALAQLVYENFSKVSDISSNIIAMDFRFLGMNLGATPSYTVFNLLFFIPIISGLTALLLTKVTNHLQYKSTGVMPANQNAMLTYMMPLFSVWIGFSLPAGLGIYWISGNLVSIAQEYFLTYYMNRKIKKLPPEEAKKKK